MDILITILIFAILIAIKVTIYGISKPFDYVKFRKAFPVEKHSSSYYDKLYKTFMKKNIKKSTIQIRKKYVR